MRVYVQGTSGFDVTTINPATVELNGAKPIAHFTRHFPHSEFLNAVYVFVGSDINLPAGYTTATFTAQTFSGQQITSSKQVLNIPFSAKVPGRLHFLLDKGTAYPGLGRLERTQAGVGHGGQHHDLPSTEGGSRPGLTLCSSVATGQLPGPGFQLGHDDSCRHPQNRRSARSVGSHPHRQDSP